MCQTYSVSHKQYIDERRDSPRHAAESERHTYALYRKEEEEGEEGPSDACAGATAEVTGTSEMEGRNEMVESEDEEMEEVEKEQGLTSETEKERCEWAGEDTGNEAGGCETGEASTGEAEPGVTCMDVDAGEETRRDEGAGCVSELDEQEGWPKWLQDVVDMLHGGERGKQMELILTKLVKIEKALGFKEEKTVSDNFRTKDQITYQREYAGKCERPAQNDEPARAGRGIHGVPQTAGQTAQNQGYPGVRILLGGVAQRTEIRRV